MNITPPNMSAKVIPVGKPRGQGLDSSTHLDDSDNMT